MEDFQEKRDELLANLVKLTQSAKFLSPSEFAFLQTDKEVKKSLEGLGERMHQAINRVFEFTSKTEDLFENEEEIQDSFGKGVYLIDNLLEKADILLDSTKKKQDNFKFKSTPPTSVKPQLQFKDPVNNSQNPWTPIITYKPNAKVPLQNEISPEMAEHMSNFPQNSVQNAPVHPYQYEIQTIEYPSRMFELTEPTKADAMEVEKAVWVDTEEALSEMCEVLANAKEIAVDLEHHDLRSYLGFSCLIQISTRKADYLVDAIKLRSDLHVLNETFTNPEIVKVLHGADMDIQWLQRDFGVYIVNLFDTYHASVLLNMEKKSLAYLLQSFCNITADKKFQLADWRIRPLSHAMKSYAQADTHYLLYIYDIMRNQLLMEKSPDFPDLLKECLTRSEQTCLTQYVKPIYNAETGEGGGGWAKIILKCPDVLNEENVAVLRAVHGWRDHLARQEDESPTYILPKHMLLNIARVMPITEKHLLAQCNPIPAFVRLYAAELVKLIESAIASVRTKNLAKPKAEETVSGKEKQAETTLELAPRKVKTKISIQVSKSSQLLGDFDLKKKEIQYQSFEIAVPDLPSDESEDEPMEIEEAPKPVNFMDVLTKPITEEIKPKPEVPKIRKLIDEKPPRPPKKPKVSSEFKPFNYEDKLLDVEANSSKFFDPMADFQNQKEKKIKSKSKRKGKSMSFK